MSYYRLEIYYTHPAGQIMNVLHYKDANNAGSPLGLCDAFDELVMDDLIAVMSNAVMVNTLRAVDVSTLAEGQKDITLTGTAAVDLLPPQCTYLLSLKTAFADRSKKGRIYIPGPGESGQASGVVNPASLSAVQDLGNALIQLTAEDDQYNLMVYSRKNNEFTDVETIIASNHICTQRRRGYGRGS